MRILVVTHHLNNFSGSETYVYTLTKGLKSDGHEVFVYTPFCGVIADKIRDNDIFVSNDISKIKNVGQFDVIHAQHNITTLIAREFFPHTPMIQMIHGLHFLEQPPLGNLGINRYVGMCNGTQKRLQRTFGLDHVDIVLNPIDTERFISKKAIHKELKNILVISNHLDKSQAELIKEACIELKIHLEIIGLPDRPVWNVEDFINEADLVITLGRGILESMACERAVMVYDHYGADGILTEDLFWKSVERNLSGLKFQYNYTLDELIQEITKYDQNMGKINRTIILDHFTIENHVSRMIQIYIEAIEQYDPKTINIPNVSSYLFFYQEYIRNMIHMPF